MLPCFQLATRATDHLAPPGTAVGAFEPPFRASPQNAQGEQSCPCQWRRRTEPTEGYRWGTFYCESDEKPDIDLDNDDGYEIGQDEYEWELESLDDGCWAEWEYPDEITEEEREEIENAWEENYFEGMEELGWSNDDTDYILQGPLELSDEDGNVVGSGDTE